MKHDDLHAMWFLPLAALVTPASAADYLNVGQAQRLLFPQAEGFVEQPLMISKEQRKEIKKRAGVRQREELQPLWRVQQDGKNIGWFFVDEVIGKHEYITYAAGISNSGEVIGIEIMSYRETHGGEVRNADWRANFKGKTLHDVFRLDKDVPNISGATLSCRNILDGVKRLLVIQQMLLEEGNA